MLRNPIRLLALVLLCGIEAAALRADEPEKTGVKHDSPLPARADSAQPPKAEPLKTGKNRDTLLYVRTDPPGATVFLNGKKLGTTNNLFPVEPGSGTILLELEGHQTGPRPVIVRANGITRVEVILAPQAKGVTAESEPNAGPPKAKKVDFIVGGKFDKGDEIAIQEVWSERGTLAEGDTVTVKGTYTLSSQPEATMLFSITTKDVSQDKATLRRQVQAGTAVPFEMTRPITCDGMLHIGFYSNQSGNALGNVYFGPKARAGGMGQSPQVIPGTAKKKMEFSLGPKAFQEDDKIEIQEVWSERGTLAKGDTVKVKGTYTLRSKPAATLAFYVTASSPADAYGPGLERQVKAGAVVPFEMERLITCDGHLHLGFYPPQRGECFGTVYFGTETQMKEIADWQEGWVNKINRPEGEGKAKE